VALANRLLPALNVGVPDAVSLRRDGTLEILPVTDLAAATVAAVQSALTFEGSIAVICADASVATYAAALRTAGLPAASTMDAAGGDPDGKVSEEDARVSVVPATLAKGLEFDHVIVVEPAEIVSAEPRGLNRLYVVLTRAVSRLTVLHSAPLPLP